MAPDAASKNTSFFCVPIMHGKKVLGTISAERVYMNRRLLKQDVELLATIASMIAPAAELYLQENIDKVRLENENRRLSNALKERFKPSNIIGNSKPMKEVYELIRQGGGHQGDGADPGRKRRRQGASGERDPL